MSNTLKNLPEFTENDSQYELALRQRTKYLAQFSLLGPPDLCYLTKEFHRSLNISFSKPSIHGYYHFNYGLCPSSPLDVSKYLSKLLSDQESDGNWFSNGKWNISKAIYCVFDVFSRIDVRVEIKLPFVNGDNISCYGITSNEEIVQVEEKNWEMVYVSSVLRAMRPERIPVVKLYKEFHRFEELEHFFQIIINSMDKIDMPIEPYELLTVKGNKILNIICDYLISKKRYTIGIKFFTYLMEYDFHNVVFLCNIFDSIGNSLDTIKLISPLLQKFPHNFSLIYQEALSLTQMKRYDLAGKLTWSLIQMIPEAFEAWLLLMEIYLCSKNYEAALVTLNVAPINPKKAFNNGFCFPADEKTMVENISEPKERGHSDYFYFNFEIENPDFRYTKLNDEYKYIQQDFFEENKKKEENLNKMPANKLQDQELRLYMMLVRIEAEISWEKLLLLRAQLFLMEDSVNSRGFSNYNSKFSTNNNSNNSGNNNNNNAFGGKVRGRPANNSVIAGGGENVTGKIEDYEIFLENEGEINYNNNNNNTILSAKTDGNPANNPSTKVQKNPQQKALDIANKKKPMDSNEILNETDEDDSDKEHELPSFLKPEDESTVKDPSNNHIKSLTIDKKMDLSEDMSLSVPVNFPAGSISIDERLNVPIKPIKISEDIENLAQKKKPPEENLKDLNTHELSIRHMSKKSGMEGVPFENPLLDFSKKRLCSKLTDSLFEALYEDLNALYEWSHEEFLRQNRKKGKKGKFEDEDDDYESKDEEEDDEYIEDLKVSGKLWVLRGKLAQRLLRTRFAETAYRKAVERGFSLFAWRRLLGIYSEIENFKASLVCIAEILDELENEGVENFVFLPKWIEDAILQIITKIGYKGLTNLLSELNLDDSSINELIKEAAYWKVEGAVAI